MFSRSGKTPLEEGLSGNRMDKTEIEKLNSIFSPHTHARIQEFKKENSRFVHYTSAEAAMCILKSREFWMRDSSCMNDYTEVQHGLNCIIRAYTNEAVGAKFKAALNGIFEGITTDIERHFDHTMHILRGESYLACLSEHLTSKEDGLGRLSMWRAYCGNAGVAIVMNSETILDGPGVLGVITAPVEYLDDAAFAKRLVEVSEKVQTETEYLKTLGKDAVTNLVLGMLRISALSTKHPGFHEEKEWRVIHSPIFGASKYLQRTIANISGVPQPVFKIPLRTPSDGVRTGAELPALINRIIIGPSQYPVSLAKAFTELLREAGVPEPEKKVFISGLPLRQ